MTPTPAERILAYLDGMDGELKPCPFCKADGKVRDRRGIASPAFDVICSKGCCSMWPHHTPEEAIVAWNKRLEGTDDALRVAVDTLEVLARLGNGNEYGNSHGNVIAQQAIAAIAEKMGV